MAGPDGVRLLRQGDVLFESLQHLGAPGLEHSAPSMTATNITKLAAGFLRFNSGELADWTLQYDEVLYVNVGQVEITSGSHSVVAEPGEAILMARGTRVTF